MDVVGLGDCLEVLFVVYFDWKFGGVEGWVLVYWMVVVELSEGFVVLFEILVLEFEVG